MSYILEALRRAEAERARGRVPDLHAQPVAPGALLPRARQRWPSALRVAAGIALVAAAAGYWWSQTTTRARSAAAAAADAPAGPTGGSGRTAVDVAAAPAASPAPIAAATALPPAPRPAPVLPIVVSAPAPLAEVRPTAPIPIAALPPAERSELGRVAIGGSVYSDDPAARFVIVDGQLLHEGESTSRGLRIERIGARSVVLRWRERSVELPL